MQDSTLPVIYLAYAYSREDRLNALRDEDNQVYDVLVERRIGGDYLVYRQPTLSLKEIEKGLRKFEGRIALFMYSGHADQEGLIFDDSGANAKGLAAHLSHSAKTGNLKLVVLNGCCTGAQVPLFLDVGTPAVIGTSAPVKDESATLFAIRFFQDLAAKRKTIRESFRAGLEAAQTAPGINLRLDQKHIHRGAGRIAERRNEPLWGLHYQHASDIDSNPLPTGSQSYAKGDFVPNEMLTKVLFDTLFQAGNEDIKDLKKKEERKGVLPNTEKANMIFNVLPFPISKHLQRLLCPVDKYEGYDKVTPGRVKQIGRLYQITSQFLAFVYISQWWEWQTKEMIEEIPGDLVEILKAYFKLGTREKRTHDYLALIRHMGNIAKSLPPNAKRKYFMADLADLSGLTQPDHPFRKAGSTLLDIHKSCRAGPIDKKDIPFLCRQGEEALCTLFSELGFLHAYDLASIQNIDVRKNRHQVQAVFSHEMIKLMHAMGTPKHHFYLHRDVLDNRGVALIKSEVRVKDKDKWEFDVLDIQSLNLSPFIIDRNSFEASADLYYLMFLDHYRPTWDSYFYRNYKNPDRDNEGQEVKAGGSFHAIHQQVVAFRRSVLREEEE